MFFRTLLFFLFFSFSLRADQNDQRLDNLFSILLETKNDIEINQIVQNIWKIWYETNDPLIEADFYRGLESMRTGDIIMSVAFFTRVIEKKPNFAEAWNKRATAYFLLGNYYKSMSDINITLKLEPRHFGAMDGMGLIFIEYKQFDKAIEIYNQMLKIFPYDKSIIEKIEKVRKKILNSV